MRVGKQVRKNNCFIMSHSSFAKWLSVCLQARLCCCGFDSRCNHSGKCIFEILIIFDVLEFCKCKNEFCKNFRRKKLHSRQKNLKYRFHRL